MIVVQYSQEVAAMHSLLDPLLPLWGVCEYEGGRVIAAAFPYLLPEERYAGRNVSRYAVVRDYHDICGARLERACALLRGAFPGERFDWRCDSAALPEVELAVKAGLGARGRHNLLITEPYGSWVFLGEIASSAKFTACCRLSSVNCTSCGACVKACPTGALGKDGFCREKCLSHITQRKGGLAPEEAALLRRAGAAWGCDLCQEACPHNRNTKVEPLPEFLDDPVARVTEDTPVAGRAYAWRGEAVLRRNIAILSTAACVLPS
jgi:epoxyqueuosine reductase QueG